MNYIPLEARKARALVGKTWVINGVNYRFGKQFCGGEAYVFPMLDEQEQLAAYLRFVKPSKASPARIERTSWLIGQQLPKVSEVFLGAPSAWVSTGIYGRPKSIKFDFTATFHHAVPGVSWGELKLSNETEDGVLPSMAVRIQMAKNLIAHLAILEYLGIVHGDLSGSNFMVDPKTGKAYLIDFDGFVFSKSKTLKKPKLTIKDGGVKGTPGYLPPDLEETQSKLAAPYCDRHARDILLVELLAIQEGDSADVSPKFWCNPLVTWNRLKPHATELGLLHLLQADFFQLTSAQRPSSLDLAIAANCAMPTLDRGTGRKRPRNKWRLLKIRRVAKDTALSDELLNAKPIWPPAPLSSEEISRNRTLASAAKNASEKPWYSFVKASWLSRTNGKVPSPRKKPKEATRTQKIPSQPYVELVTEDDITGLVAWGGVIPGILGCFVHWIVGAAMACFVLLVFSLLVGGRYLYNFFLKWGARHG